MRKRVVVSAAVALMLAFGVVAAVRWLPKGAPELTNPADFELYEPYPDTPDFFVSDPALSRKTAHEIKLQYVDQTKTGLDNAAYFIELENGRYAFGYTGKAGLTRPIYTDRAETFKAYWVQDALERWFQKARGRRSRSD